MNVPPLIVPSAEKLDLPLLSATTLHQGGNGADVIMALFMVTLVVMVAIIVAPVLCP